MKLGVFHKNISKVLIALNILTLIVLFMCCFNVSIWPDEVCDLNMIKHPFGYFLLNSRDASPPFHFAILKLFVDSFALVAPGINYIYVSKFCSLVPYIIICVISNTYVRKKFGEHSGALCGLLCVTMPAMFVFGIEIRQYSWAVVLAFVWFLFFYEYITSEKKRYAFILAFVGPLAVFGHYFTVFGIVYAYVLYGIHCLVKKKYKQIITLALASVISCGLFSLWLMVAMKRIMNSASNFWLPQVTAGDVVASFIFPFKADVDKLHSGTVVAIILLGFIAYFLYRWIKAERSAENLFVIAGLTIPFIVTIVGLLIGRYAFSVFQPRYIMPVMACCWMCFAISLSRIMKPGYIKMALMMFLLLVAVLNVAKHTKDEKEYADNIAVLNDFLDNNNGLLVVDDSRLSTCLPFYTNETICNIDEADNANFVASSVFGGEDVFYLHSDMAQGNGEYMDGLKKKGLIFEKITDCGIEYIGIEIYKLGSN